VLDIRVDRQADRPIFLQIADELERLTVDGTEGLRLPPSRDLAARLGVNRNTVVSAYQELIARGRATARTGRGTFLRPPAGARAPWSEAVRDDAFREPRDLHGAPDADYSFAANFPPEDLLPAEALRRALDDVLRREGARLLTYGSPQGYRPLREWIAGEMRRQGAEVPVDEVIITTGSQQAIDLAARALLGPGDRVLLEEPGFPLAIAAFRSHGARVEGLPSDGDGLQTDRLARAVEEAPARLIYLVPDFHNPTGACLSEARRRQVLDLAHRHGVPILEDDSSAWLRFCGAPLPSLRGLDAHGLTIFASTFSKMLMPGVRIGWICAPAPIRDRLLALKQLTDCTTSLLLQAAVHEFCRDGGLDEHLRRVRAAYRERRDALLGAMRRHFPAEVRWTEPEGGLVLWVSLPAGLDGRGVAAEARTRGIACNPGDLFFIDAAPRGHLRLTFAGMPPARIRQGARLLGDVLRGLCERSAAGRDGGEAALLV
jgi:GntR family transcriptional regulator/MocR family aminotransferase